MTLAQAQPLGFWGKSVEGSGHVVQQNRVAKDFRTIQVAISGKIELKQGDAEGLSIETDDNIQDMIETVVEGKVLKIRMRERNTYPSTRTLRIVVNFRQLNEVSVDGSGSVTCADLVAGDFKARLSGSGNMQIQNLKSDSLKVAIGGSGNFKAQGQSPQIVASIGGSGDIDMAKLAAKDVRVSIGGSGSVSTWASDNLSVSIGGSGSVEYYGDPRVSKSVGGSGSVTRRGSQP